MAASGGMTADEVNAVLRQAESRETVSVPPPDVGSVRTHVHLLRTVVVKAARRPGDVRMRRERDALVHLADTDLPVPRLLAHGDLPDGRPWVVVTRLRGFPARGPSDRLWAELGALAARLHGAPPPPGFGTWSRDPGITLIAEQRQRVRDVAHRARRAGRVPDHELAAVVDLLARQEPALETAPHLPVLAHRDLQPSNALVDRDGRLCGLVDFESAGGGDPAEDFSRVALDWTDSTLAAFCRAYRDAGGHVDRHAGARVTYHVLYWALLIFAGVGRRAYRLSAAARTAVRRIADGDRPSADAHPAASAVDDRRARSVHAPP